MEIPRKFFKSGENLDVQTSRLPKDDQQNAKRVPAILRKPKSLTLKNYIGYHPRVRTIPASPVKRQFSPDYTQDEDSLYFDYSESDKSPLRSSENFYNSSRPSPRPSASKLSLSLTSPPNVTRFEEVETSPEAATVPVKRPAQESCSSLLDDFDDSFKRPKTPKTMSLYDRRYQSDDRPVSNGYLSSRNNSSAHNNDENNPNAITSHYYSSSSSNSASTSHQSSMSTLCNIGNTCYLNSVVYTLRFAPLFLHNLHHLVDDLANIQQNIGKNRAKSSSLGRNIPGITMENARSWSSKDLASLENLNSNADGAAASSSLAAQKSSQQIATERLHELYQSLHRNEILDTTDPFHADTFLQAIQDVSSIFEGNQQQDAHEFLMCVLDSIRETSQSLIKSISECPDAIINGNVSFPEQAESNPSSNKKEQSAQQTNNSNSSSSSTSNITNIIKMNAFFKSKSKRKEEAKSSKILQLQSPTKDNAATQILLPNAAGEGSGSTAAGGVVTPNSSDLTDGINSSKDNKSNLATPDEELSIKDNKDKDRLAEKIKKLGLDFFTEDFEGITVATTKCLSCETITEQKETMIDIAVPVSGYDNVDYTDKTNSFIQNSCITREYFRGENKYRCEQCTGYTEAIRSISFEVLPRLLVIQLSRFSGGMEKINSYIPTPFILQCFCAKCCELGDNNKLHIYKLYSVITHVGATMSVGHYIAYTCSLDSAKEYANCPKDKRRQQQQQLSQQNKSMSSNNTGSGGSSTSGTEKNVGIVKKMIFGRSKASSSGDMSKNMKNINGISNKITNGIDKLNINTTCPSMNCCGIRLKQNLHNTNLNHQYSNGPTTNGVYNVNLVDENQQQPNGINLSAGTATGGNGGGTSTGNSNTGGSYPSSYGSTGRNKAQTAEPIWYMCDDDKIKTMTQREFEELLSPNRKITITPYLLFYARSDLQ